MRLRPLVPTALVAIAIHVAGHARADVRAQASGRLALGFTDNVDLSPTTSDVPDAEPPQADGFNEIEPGVALLFASPRSLQQLAYLFNATLYFQNSDVNSYTNRLDWTALLQPSELLQLTFSATGEQGRQNGFGLAGSAGTSSPAARLSGRELFGAGSLEQGLSWEFAPDWSLRQGLAGAAFMPIATDTEPGTFEVGGIVGIDHIWEQLRLGGELEQSYSLSLAFTDALTNERVPRAELMVTRLVAQAGYEFARAWTIEADAGALRAAEAGEPRHQFYHPTGRAALRFADGDTEIELSFNHIVRQNLFIADTFLMEEVRLRGRVPLGARRDAPVFAEATAGYDHGLAVDLEEGDILGDESLHVLLFDAGIRWQMWAGIHLTFRYQYSQQSEFAGRVFVPDFNRHLATLGIEFRMPPERTRRPLPRERTRRMDPAEWQRLFEADLPPPATTPLP